MVRGGMDVARINFSHGTYRDHRRAIRSIHQASARAGRTIALLLDLQGPRLRVGHVLGGTVRVATGSHVLLTHRNVAGTSERIPIVYSGLMRDVDVGDRVL